MYILCANWRQKSVANGREGAPPCRFAGGSVHLKEDLDVEGDCGS